jgi:hypothetical protein
LNYQFARDCLSVIALRCILDFLASFFDLFTSVLRRLVDFFAAFSTGPSFAWRPDSATRHTPIINAVLTELDSLMIK